MLTYPSVPYETFLKYAIFIYGDNKEVNDFLRESFLPPIEDEFIDARREALLNTTKKKTIRESIKGSYIPPKNRTTFNHLLKWLVETGLIFPFIYFHPQVLRRYKGIEVKVLREVFLLALHPMLRRVHNCAVFLRESREFQNWFPMRCSSPAFEWYRYIFFNPEMVETEGDWIYYFRKLDKSEAKLYDAAKRNNIKFCIWLLGGIPQISLEELQENLQSISYWGTLEKMRTDFVGGEPEDRGDPEAKRWARIGIDTMKASTPKALPPPHLEDEESFEQVIDAEEIKDSDIQQEIPVFEGPLEGRKKKNQEEGIHH